MTDAHNVGVILSDDRARDNPSRTCHVSLFAADAPCIATFARYDKIYSTDRFLCVIGADKDIFFLDPANVQRGLIPFDYGDWTLRHHGNGVLVFALGYETLVWHIDSCTGVRCELPPLSDLTSFAECHGAVFLTFYAAKQYSVYLAPMLPTQTNPYRMPDRVPGTSLVKARLVYEHKDEFRGAELACGNATFSPVFYRRSDRTVWLVEVSAKQLTWAHCTPH